MCNVIPLFLVFMIVYNIYYNYRNFIFNLIHIQVFLEEKAQQILLYFEKKEVYYSLKDFKQYNDFQNEKMLKKINHNNITKYLITSDNSQLDYTKFKKSVLFSSVVLYINTTEIDVTGLINKFNISGQIIRFNKELAIIVLFLKNIDMKTDNITKTKWGIITNKIDMYESETISFKIKDDNLILYKE